MKPYLLVIDKNPNIEKAEILTALFEQEGIGTILVASMFEALKNANHPSVIGIGINADTVDYIDMLKILRDAFSVAIIIVTSNYDVRECSEALKAGANFYDDWRDNLEEHVMRALAEIESYNEAHSLTKLNSKFIRRNNILIYPKFREVYVRDKRVKLMKLEYNLLYYLMSNYDCICTYKRIYRYVWKEEVAEDYPQRIYVQITRLRKRIFLDTGETDCIYTDAGIGYKFMTMPDA